ncbi:hypothetical protein THAOC_36806 [Thalassiosira oceanica]|uniref:Uncharacterized protein n=2 Tax=Thalassiosira oceanica TaxID=159749 RepID=K0QZK4_THAOC|nr:hypothetical protein THAOC_36806 [Thalassiosira oceanica]|eukprot:EJK44640.1 hypothetical protein THAOC_36806 [Thalassiosira oceanica]
MANIGRRCAKEVSEVGNPDQNRPPFTILASAKAVGPGDRQSFLASNDKVSPLVDTLASEIDDFQTDIKAVRWEKHVPWYVFTVQTQNYDTLTKSTSDATDTRDRYCKLRSMEDIDRDGPITCRTFDLDSKLHGESDKATPRARKMGDGAFTDAMHVKKNPYVEEWNGRREITEKAFEVTQDNLLPLILMCVAFPYGIYHFTRKEMLIKKDPRVVRSGVA